MFTAALGIIAKKYEQCKCPLTDKKNITWYIHMLDYFSLKKK